MPSDWYSQFMRLNGFDIEDPYFENKFAAFTPKPLGMEFETDKDITDYFQSGGEYDRAAGGMTGLTANIKDTAMNFGRAVEEGGLRAMAVPLDFFGSIGSGMADEFDKEKEAEYLSTKDPEAKYKTGMESLYTGLLRSQSGAAEALRGAADSVSQARTEGAALPSFGTSLSDPLSQFKDAEGIKENTYAAGRTLADAFVGGIDIATDMGAAAVLGAPIVKALGIGGNAVGSLADDAGKLAKSAAYVKDAMTSAVGVGFGVKSFSDMYESQTQSNSDSRVKAIAIAAPYAALSGALEGIGALETFGERVLTKHLIGDGVTSWIGRRAAATALGGASEGTTEYAQQWSQILAEELPSNSANDKDPMDAWSRIKERAPEAWQAALGGFLFGGAIGGVKGVGRVAAADADAVADKDKKDPNTVVKDLSNGVNTPTETLLSGMGDAIVAPAIASVEVKNVAADLADKFVAATEKREELVADAKFETLDAATIDTAKIQSATEEKAEEVTNEMVNGVLALSQNKLAQFDNIVLGVQNFIQSMATNQPIALPNAPDQDSSSSLAKMSQQMDPRVVAQGFAKQFKKLGIDPEVFANGISNVDMNALRSEFEASLVKQASNNLLPMAEAIEKAREPEPDSVVAQNIEKIKAQAGPQESANTKYQKLVDFVKTVPMITVSDIQKTLGVSLKSARAHAAQLVKDGIIGPRRGNQPRQVLLAQEERAEPAKDILLKRSSAPGWSEATSAGPQASPKDVSPTEAVATKLLAFIKDKKSSERGITAGGRVNKARSIALDWITKPFRLVSKKVYNGLQTIDLDLPDYSDISGSDDMYLKMVGTHGNDAEQDYADAIVNQIRADTKVSERFHNEVTVPFAKTIAARREELRSLTSVPDGAGKTARIRNAKASIMKEVNAYREALARQNIPPGVSRSVHDAGVHIINVYRSFFNPTDDELYEEIKETFTGDAGLFVGTEKQREQADEAGEAAPAAKIISSWLYTHASPELSRKIIAKMIGQEYSMEESNEMATQLAEELAEHGLFESLPSEDLFTKRAFLDSIVNQGKSTSSPHGLYTALVTAGEDPSVAMATVASVHAMSVALAKSNGASYASFWDRLADSIVSAKSVDPSGILPSGLYNPVNRKNRQEFDGKRVSLFANASIQVLGKSIVNIDNSPSVVMQHEIMHALHASGLLLDILGPDGIRALEDVIDGPLYSLHGEALIGKEYEETQERLAIVWEIFLATQKAPTTELQPAFDAAKNFFRTFLNYFLKMVESVFDVRLWEIERVGDGKMPFRLSDGNYDTYHAQSKKLLENKDAISALYRLINAQPETEAHMATGGLTMATGALTTEMSEIVGMDMSGALDAEPMNGDVLSRASDQWAPESGTAPTDDQMADMLGYSGMNTEDQGVKDALKHHKNTTGVRLKVWAMPQQKQFVASDFESIKDHGVVFQEAIAEAANYVVANGKEYNGKIVNNPDHPRIIEQALRHVQFYTTKWDNKPEVKLESQKWIRSLGYGQSDISLSSIDMTPIGESIDDEMVGLDKEKLVGPAVHIFPKDRKLTADDLPDAAEANRTRWYHGSRIGTIAQRGISSVLGKLGIVGTGGYLSDNGYEADRYRTLRAGKASTDAEEGDLYALKVNVRKVLNLEKPMDLDIRKIVAQSLYTLLMKHYGAPVVKQFREARGRHDANTSHAAFLGRDYNRLSKEHQDRDVYSYPDREFSEMTQKLQRLRDELSISNDQWSKSREELDSIRKNYPTKLYSLLEKIANLEYNEGSGAKRSGMAILSKAVAISEDIRYANIGISRAEEKAAFNEIEFQLRKQGIDAYTHISTQSDGTQHRVLILLDPSNDISGEYPPVVEKYWETRRVPVEHGPFLRKGGWGPREDKKKQKMALKIMEKAGSLRGSLDAAAWLQSVYDGWTAGRNNPAFNNEEIETNAVGVGTLMTEYARLWRKFIDEPHLNETMAAINKTLPYIGSASRRAIVDIWTGMTRNLVDVLDPIEKAVQDIGLPAVKHHINNMHSLTTWASKITERVPQYFDRTVGKLGDWVKILGSESWRSIDNDFLRWADAYYAKNEKQLPDKTSRRFRIKAARDLKLWMLAQREIEIFENADKQVAKYLADKKAFDESNGPGAKSPAEVGKMIAANDKGPQPPKIPQISKAALALARNVVTVMKMTYGEDIHALDTISMRFSKWETDSKLVPLLKANMITAKQYADIRTSGLRHVPLHRIKELVDATGALNPKIDGSMYEVLDYLKRDLSFKVEDPLAAAIASVQAINMLVQRQVAKNALGEAVRDNVPIGTKHGEFVMLHSKKKISKEAYDKLPDEKRYSEKHKKHDPDGESGNAMVEEYYEIVPATKDDIDDILKKLRDKMHGIKDKKKLKEAQITMNGAIFAAYLEPGVPTYFRITDATVAESFYMMNNPQALYSQNAYVKALAATQRWFKGQYVTSPQFIYNMLARDIPNAIIRSKHGLRTSDVVRGLVASLDMAGFEQVNDYLDKKGKGQEISDDAIQGFGPFGGLITSTSAGGKMDMDLLMAASHDGLNSKNASILKQLWTSYTGNLKLHGVAFPTMKDVSEAFKKGDWGVAGDVVTLVPKMVFSLPRAIMSVPGNILEQAPRLAERRLMMDVNVTRDFPMLLEKFPERYQLDGNGQVLAGYAGRLHRKRWEAAAKRLKADPNAVVAKEDLPIQYGAMEKDYDTRQVTLPFDQKGKWTPVIDLGHIFFGPAMLDMYTNITQIGNNSVTQGIADLMRSKEEIIERKKKLNYNVADILGKEIKYTDQDGRALAMFIKAIAVITIPAIAQAFIYRDDDEWQAQSFAEKLSYYHIPSPWGGRFRIARGLGIMQLLFSDLPTAIMLEFSDKDPKAFEKWGKRFFQSTPLGAVMAGPVAFASGMGGADAAKVALGEVTPEILKGTSEAVFTDFDTYRDKQVSYETGFAPEDPTRVKAERFNILANLVARIENVQPAQAQHQIESLFPGTKKIIPALANQALESAYGATDTGLPPEVQPSNAPIYGQATGAPIRFYSRSPFGVGNEYVQSIYKLNRILTGYENTAEKLPETSKMLYKAQHPELEHLKIIQDAAERIKSHNEKIIQLRKDGLSKGDNAQTEYDLNKLMTVEAMETYRLFYGKLMGD